MFFCADAPKGPPACGGRARGLSGGIASESPMAAILPIFLFVLAVVAINVVEFKRPD